MSKSDVKPSTEGQGNESVVSDAQSSSVTLDLLPPEILENILMKIQEPLDLLNCSKVNSILHSLLQDKKPSLYFHLTLPHLLKYLDNSDLLACCQVSQLWMNAVASAVNQYKDDYYWLRDIDDLEYRRPIKLLKLKSASEISKFLTNLDHGSQLNSMLFNHISISYSLYFAVMFLRKSGPTTDRRMIREVLHYDNLNFFNKSVDLFRKSGQFVTHLILENNQTLLNGISIFTTVTHSIRCTPALQDLCVKFNYAPYTATALDVEQHRYEISTFLEANPLPDLPCLTTIRLALCNWEIGKNILDRYKSQVCHLVLDQSQLGEINNEHFVLPQLENLEVEIRTLENFTNLTNFVNFSEVSLKKFRLEVNLQGTQPVPGLKDAIVEFVNGMKSLELLSISYFQSDDWLLVQELEMMNIKELNLKMLWDLPVLESLYRFNAPNLEKLRAAYPWWIDQVVIDEFKKLYNSCFWRQHPNMKEVMAFLPNNLLDVQVVYTRAGYDLWQLKNSHANASSDHD